MILRALFFGNSAEIIEQVTDKTRDTLMKHKDLFKDYPFIYKAVEQAIGNAARK